MIELLSWRAIGRVLVTLLLVWIVIRTWLLWVLLFIAVIVAAAMLPAVRWTDRYRIPRIVTVVGIYLAGFFVLGLLGRFLAPALAEQFRQFARQLPDLLENAKRWAGKVAAWGERWDIPLPALPTDGLSLQGLGDVLVAGTLRLTADVISAVVGFFLILIVAAYLVIDAERVGGHLLALIRPPHRERIRAVTPAIVKGMGEYVRGQALVSLAVGACVAVGLMVLRVPYALLIGAVATVLNVVPFLGSPAAALLGILAALNVSPMHALWTALLFWGVSVIEGKLFVPFFVGRATGLHPLAVLVGILIGLELAGVVGALIAVPLLAAAWEVLRVLYLEPMQRPAASRR